MDAHYYAAKALIVHAGQKLPKDLTRADALAANATATATHLAPWTRANRNRNLRRILRWLCEEHHAPSLAKYLPRPHVPRPRNVTATHAEREAIMTTAPPYLRAWLLLCSDLALRSGTAARIAPRHYNPETRELRFSTKFENTQTLPVTAEIAALFGVAADDPFMPLTAQLHPYRHDLTVNYLRRKFRELKHTLGITRKLIPHDLRRTTAVAAYDATKDLRTVQAILGHRHLSSTLYYLDHDAAQIDRAVLENAKRNTPKGTP